MLWLKDLREDSYVSLMRSSAETFVFFLNHSSLVLPLYLIAMISIYSIDITFLQFLRQTLYVTTIRTHNYRDHRIVEYFRSFTTEKYNE